MIICSTGYENGCARCLYGKRLVCIDTCTRETDSQANASQLTLALYMMTHASSSHGWPAKDGSEKGGNHARRC